MSKQEFVAELFKNKDHIGITTAKQASLIFDCFTDILKDKLQHLAEGQHFRFHNIGSFCMRRIKSRNVRSPRTGEIITVPESKRIRFKSHISSN